MILRPWLAQTNHYDTHQIVVFGFFLRFSNQLFGFDGVPGKRIFKTI